MYPYVYVNRACNANNNCEDVTDKCTQTERLNGRNNKPKAPLERHAGKSKCTTNPPQPLKTSKSFLGKNVASKKRACEYKCKCAKGNARENHLCHHGLLCFGANALLLLCCLAVALLLLCC